MQKMDFVQKLKNKTASEPSLASIKRLAYDLSSYDNQIVAGQCLIWLINGGSFSDYLELHRHLFNTRVENFFDVYRNRLDVWCNDNHNLNYVNRDFFSASTMIRNYLLRIGPDEKETYETPLFMFLRVATQLHAPNIDKVLEVTLEMVKGYYIQSSPTLFNSGLKKHQLASCFLLRIEDDLEDILGTGVKDAGIISACGGGLGIGINNVRHSQIGYHGMSNGVVPLAHVYDRLVEYANQSGKRKGAGTAFLSIWHVDIQEFIASTNNYNISARDRFESLNTCIWMHNIFFERVKSKSDWTLFCPATVPSLKSIYGKDFEKEYLRLEKLGEEHQITLESLKNNKVEYHKFKRNCIVFKKVPAMVLFEKIIDLQIKSGMPYLCNGDNINSKSNHSNIGPIDSSNLCLEIMEATPKIDDERSIASCNLASLNLSIYVKDGVYDYESLSRMTRSCITNLNAVIDNNYYPLNKVEKLNHVSRPVGLGVSGLTDAFAQMHINPGSKESFKMNKMIFACIYFNSILESIKLAIQSSPYRLFKGSPMSEGKFQFDLWRQNPGSSKDYDPLDDEPIDPSEWGQKEFSLPNGHIIEPNWDALRDAMVKFGVRNSLMIALMPTASSSQTLRNAETTEYHQSNIYSRNVQGGRFAVLNRWMVADFGDLWSSKLADFIIMCGGSLKFIYEWFADHHPNMSEDMKEKILNIKELYKTQFEVSQKMLIKMERQRGIYVDQSQSFNLYMESPTINSMKAAHMYSAGMGNKTQMYYLRSKPPSQAMGYGLDEEVKSYYLGLMTKLGYDVSKSGKVERVQEVPTCSACE